MLLFAPQLEAAEEVKASHILVRTVDEADIVLNEIMENGGDRKAFIDAARKYSKDVMSKRVGDGSLALCRMTGAGSTQPNRGASYKVPRLVVFRKEHELPSAGSGTVLKATAPRRGERTDAIRVTQRPGADR